MAEPDLHARLRTAIMERLALAQAAAITCGCHPGQPWAEWTLIDDHITFTPTGHVVAGGEGWPAALDTDVAAHMAANDPAFVIRACRVDLARLEDHTPQQSDGMRFCPACNSENRYQRPCPEVRSLAEVYAVEVT